MLNHNVNNIHAKQLHFDVSIIYTKTVHYIASVGITFTRTVTDTRNNFYHTTYTFLLQNYGVVEIYNSLTIRKKRTFER